MTRTELRQLYQERKKRADSQAEHLAKRYQRLGWVRLIVFLASFAAVFLLFSVHWMVGMIGTFTLLIGFIAFVRWHQGIKRQEKHQRSLSTLNLWELQALDHDFQVFADGAGFLDPEHPNALDLDLFGPHSLYQYLNRTSTFLGRKRLARWLTEVAAPSVIHERQEAIQKLTPELTWRQEWQARGMETRDAPEQLRLLMAWIGQPNYLRPQRWIRWALVLLPVLTLGALSYCIPFQPWYICLICILPNAWMLRKYTERINRTHQQTTHAEAALSRYAMLVNYTAQLRSESPYLQARLDVLRTDAGEAIKTLSYQISQLNVRYNAFAIILNILGLWDLQWVYRLEGWKNKYRAELPKWFEALAELEVLSSFANAAHNNPGWHYPTFDENGHLEAVQLGHPLLPADQRVCNDLAMPTRGHIKLITGSNMAGKSTFLRTVGINLVLANCGAPVCAETLRTPVLQVYSSMRTQDALHESTSSFYAELKRLKFIIEAVERGDNIFFLLDEILKGTNSRDRHTGSKALIRQLIEQGGGGLIATHDLELGVLEEQYDGAIENLCMEVRIENQQLHFDYKLEPGVSQSFNATLLMQHMGIRITTEDTT